MKTGDLVRFKNLLAAKTDEQISYTHPYPWRVGLLIEYHTWEKVGTILYKGQIYRVRAENIQKAGKKDYENR